MHIDNKYILKLRKLFEPKTVIFIVVTAVFFSALSFVYNAFTDLMESGFSIEMNYPGSENGLNPDGSVFDITEIISDDIIDKAKNGLEMESIKNDELRECISVVNNFSSESLDEIFSSVQSSSNRVYMPTTFYVNYKQKSKLQKNEARQFVVNIASRYEEYFNDKYSEKNDILRFSVDDYNLSDKDYVEIYQILHDKIDSMLALILNHKDENRLFVSSDGETLGTLYERLLDFSNVNLEKFDAFILENGISKNNSDYLACVNYQIENNEQTFQLKDSSAKTKKEAINAYDPRIIAVAFVPSISANSYYMNRTQTGIDELTNQAQSESEAAAAAFGQIKKYEYLKEQFNIVPGSSKESIAAAEEMVRSISSELELLSAHIIDVDNEYMKHKTKNYFKITVAKPKKLINKRMMCKAFILGAFLAFILVMLFEPFVHFVKEKLIILKETFFDIIRYNKRM